VIRRAQDACIELIEKIYSMFKPGTSPAQIWETSLAFMEKAGQLEGFMGLNKNKVPFVAHGIGLYVDEPPVAAARFVAPLEENMTMAVEPKIGIPGYGMVGVENTVVVTPEGGKSLTGGMLDLHYI
jgi:Xaa-Pro aminopeptidase